jgi:hypothetical protein
MDAPAEFRHECGTAPDHGAAPRDSAAPGVLATSHAVGDLAVLLLAEFPAASRLWSYGRFATGRIAARAQPGVRFAKVLGSGFEGGFGLRPSGTRQGLFCIVDGEAAARALLQSDLVSAYRSRARESLTVLLRACSSRGSWSGATMAVTATAPSDAPIASLTRASIRPRNALRFWRMAAPAETALAAAPGCRLAVGLGEAPLLRQATFSLWDNQAAMDAYARTGAHLAAIRAAAAGRFFSESMFVRFVPIAIDGTWRGRRHG